MSSRVPTVIRSPHFWVLLSVFAIGTVVHYPQQILGTDSPSLFTFLGLTRHAVERILFLLPVTYAGLIFGVRAGAAVLAAAFIVMLPRALLVSEYPPDALLETIGVVIIGILVNLWFEGYRRERERRQQALLKLEAAQQELQSHIQTIESDERRLAALHEVSTIVSQSLELQDILDAAILKVMEVMDIEVALTFIVDDDTKELVPRAYRGVSAEFMAGLEGLKVGEGFNGQVAQSGEPLVVEDIASDPRLTRQVVEQEGLRAELIVPMKAKSKVVGTLCVATHKPRKFAPEEIVLLSQVANQIGVAVENSGLYQKERLMAEQIAEDAAQEKQMKENLRFYLQQVTRAQEEERRRIARELHDDTAQDLVVLSRRLDGLIHSANQWSPDDLTHLEQMRQQVSRILDGVRRFSQDLRPSVLDDLGLLPALEWLASDISQHFGVDVAMDVVGDVRRFHPETELVMFRIAQEALRNVWKHSGASKAWITVEFDADKTVLTVKDNGKGFELPERLGDLAGTGRLGLAGMQERAQLIGGTLNIQSKPGKGATVTAEVPD